MILKRVDKCVIRSVALKELDGEVAGRILMAYLSVFLYHLLNAVNALLELYTMVDMNVARHLRLVFVDINDLLKEGSNALTTTRHGGHHRRSEKYAQLVVIEAVAILSHLVIHIERHDHAQVHINELRGEVKVALEVGSIYHINHNIRRLLNQLTTHIALLGAIG